jgi:mRNA interferase YafQ
VRKIAFTKSFERDFKKASRSGIAFDELEGIIDLLRKDSPLPEYMRDHALSGQWKKIHARECHVKPDVLLVYAKPENELHLLRIASHSELF